MCWGEMQIKEGSKTLQLQTNLLAVKLSSGILHTILIWLNSVKDLVLVHARNNGKQKVEVHIHSELFSHWSSDACRA